MFDADPRRRLRVGLFTVLLLGLLAVAILLIGRKQGLFVKKVVYHTRFLDVGGLTPGAPVWLNGVVVGQVEDVALPSDPARREIDVEFSVHERVARRIRSDSVVRIRTLGLLGDRYLEISSGNPSMPRLPEGSAVPSEEPQSVAQVLSQGGDVVTNVLSISASLRRILDRVERGEGVLGELTVNPESGQHAIERLTAVLGQVEALLKEIRAGHGLLGRLVSDPKLEQQLVDDVAGFAHAGRQVAEELAADLKRDDSVVAELLRDPNGRERVAKTLDGLTEAAAAAAEASRQLAEGRGTLGRLMNDKQFADRFLGDLAALTASLRSVAAKLDAGKGTAGRAINDPQLWQDLEDVAHGVKRSRVLSWLIRNRRAAGAAERSAAAPTPTSPPGGRP
jgi:phospholipid/cholesterol/gamma-HCH transport system substrate-binding protein